jgi:serine/threonine protein kinase
MTMISKRQAMTICGTDNYAAPEILFQEEYSGAVDIFSFGMVLFEVHVYRIVIITTCYYMFQCYNIMFMYIMSLVDDASTGGN